MQTTARLIGLLDPDMEADSVEFFHERGVTQDFAVGNFAVGLKNDFASSFSDSGGDGLFHFFDTKLGAFGTVLAHEGAG